MVYQGTRLAALERGKPVSLSRFARDIERCWTVPDKAMEDDASLLRRCAQRDEAAWATLVRRYKGLVYTSALRTGLDDEAAEEVYQQVWVELLASLGRIRKPNALPGWLATATRRLAYKHAIAARKLVEGTFEEMVDPAALPNQELEDLQTRRQLEQGLARLGEPCAKLIRLLFLSSKKMSYVQISRRVGIAVGSIGPIRARCLARLREAMEGAT